MQTSGGDGVILVIERDARFAAKFKKHLRIDGYRTFYVESAQDALFLLDSIAANLMLVNLNGIDSWENLEALQRYGRDHGTPLWFIDGMKKTQMVADRLRKKGGIELISLPFSVSDLEKRLRGLLRGGDPLIGLMLGPEGHEVEIIKKLGAGRSEERV